MNLKKAVLVNGSLKYAAALLQILFSVILARIVAPKVYGVVAVTTVFLNFFKVIADAGIGPAVIQYRTLDNRDLNHIFTASLYVAAGLSILMIAAGIPVSVVYADQIYIRLFLWLSAAVFFHVANTVPGALLMKKKQFFQAGLRTAVSMLVSCLCALTLAAWGFGYESLIVQSIVYAAVGFFWNLFGSGLRTVWRLDTAPLRLIRRYSFYQFSFNFVNYFSRNLDNLLIGKRLGSMALAYYEKSYTLMMYPVQGLSQVVTPILHPFMAEYQNDREKIYRQYVRLVRFLSAAGAFFSVFVLWNAGEIVLFLYGRRWLGAVCCLRILGFSIWAQMMVSSTGAVYQSIGNTRLLLVNGCVGAALTVTGIATGMADGRMEAVSFFVMFSYTLNVFLTHWMMIKKGLGKSLRLFLWEIAPDFIWMACMAALYERFFAGVPYGWGLLAVKSGVIAFSYAAYLCLAKRCRYRAGRKQTAGKGGNINAS